MKLLLLVLVFVMVSCSGGRNSTGYSLINDMMYSETFEAYSDNAHFDDGQSMRPPVAGTIARGKMPHPMELGDDGVMVPSVLENPYEMSDYAWQRGEILFNRTCAACHGADGQGKTAVIEAGFPAPPKFKSRTFKYSKKAKKPAGHVYNVITFGYGNMPSHAQQLYREDRWYVAEYVREKLMVKGKK